MAAHLLTVTFVLADLRWQQHRKTSSVCDWRWSSIDCSWTRRWSRNAENYCLGNFEQDFRNDSRVCEIHSEIAHDRAERPLLWNRQDNLEMVSDDNENVLKKVITGDESWVYSYDPETKQQSSQWKRPDEPRPKTARQSRSHVKSMLIIFFDYVGVVHYEFAPRVQTINKEYYVEVLKRLRNAVRRKRPRFWSSDDWLLHHDNAPAHSSNLVQQFLAKHKIVQLRQPPYSPDSAQRKAVPRHRDDSE